MAVTFLSRYLHFITKQGPRRCCAASFRLNSTSTGSESSGPQKPRQDPVSMALRNAPTQADILKIAGIHWRHMEPHQVILSLRALHDLQKSSRSDWSEIDVSRTDEFTLLCKTLRRHIRSLEITEILDALKVVTFFKIHSKSAIVQGLLHMLKNDVNSLSMPQITFLAFLLRKYPKDPVVDALKIALPIVFEANLPVKLERKNVGMLVDALMFCSKNRVNRQCVNTIVSAFNELDQLEWLAMDPKRARSIMISLCDIGVNEPLYEDLYKNASAVVSKNLDVFNFSEIEHLLGLSIKSSNRIPYMQDRELLEAVSDLGVTRKWSLQECCILLRKLNRTGVVSRNLLNYMAGKILDNPEEFREARFGTIKSFVGGLAVANYKTDHWNILKDLIPTSKCFDQVRPTEPWLPLCSDLASLDIYSHRLLEQVFDSTFLNDYVAREYNKLDLLQLLRLYQAVVALHQEYDGPWPPEDLLEDAIDINGGNVSEFPLKGVLELGMGGPDYVLTRCFADHGHFIDHVVVLRRGGHATAFPNSRALDKVMLHQLTFPPDSLKVAIRYLPSTWYNCYKQLRGFAVLAQRVLESQGFVVVNVSKEDWLKMPDWEKNPYLLQLLRLNSQQIYSENQSLV